MTIEFKNHGQDARATRQAARATARDTGRGGNTTPARRHVGTQARRLRALVRRARDVLQRGRRLLGGQDAHPTRGSGGQDAHPTHRIPPRGVLCVLCVLCGCILFGGGCAFDRAVGAAADAARGVSVALIEKSTITQTNATAGGTINDPHYRVLAVAVQGVYLDIGLDGVTVHGDISGQGGGADKPLSAETMRAIHEQLLRDDSFRAWLLEAAKQAK